ncbi:MAG TPA: diguanylate cyclase [Candidatus Limnocylindria bacterium]|nr:diguanylate cyclase [Candidatus Limnocylindria bacterium]
MRPAMSRPSRALLLPGVGRFAAVRPRRGRRPGRRLAPLITRDPYLAYSAALVPIAALVLLLSRGAASLIALAVVSFVFVGAQLMLARVPGRFRPLSALGWSFLRLAIALLFVAGIVELAGGPGGPLDALFIPVVVGAAAIGPIQALVIGGVASVIYLAPEITRMGSSADLALRGITLAGVSMLVAFGTRRLVVTLERTTRQLRSAILAERRRSRQITGLEAVSRLLVAGGPTNEVLDRALGVLVDRFGYSYVSIYIADEARLVLGAQRGYDHPIESFDGTLGVMGRVMRTHEMAYVPDVSKDPDYISVFNEVTSEICAPLLIDGQFLGALNIESKDPLDRTDRDLVATLAGRVATVVALGHDRQALADRAAVFRSLHEFTQAVSATLDLDRLAASLVEAARRVVQADIVVLTVLDQESGHYRVRAITDVVDESQLGREVRPGEGLAGRAIRDRTVVIDDNFTTEQFPASYRDDAKPMTMLGAGIPLVRDSVVVGALSIVRHDLEDRFRPIEREAMELLAGHAALALANAFLHAEVEQLAIRDPLTDLYNRRYFDEAVERLIASWHRAAGPGRRPISAIVFDLDHFGDFNKRHGHQVGDLVLRTFARILRGRFRNTDLVARLGGEEFIVVLEGATRSEAEKLADEVRTSLKSTGLANEDGERLSVTVSAGCTQLEDALATRESLLRTADVALFMAKRAGRDRVVAA